MNDTPQSETQEIKTGFERATVRLQAKAKANAKFYENAETGELSRQFRRRLKRMVASKELSEKKREALKNRKIGQTKNSA